MLASARGVGIMAGCWLIVSVSMAVAACPSFAVMRVVGRGYVYNLFMSGDISFDVLLPKIVAINGGLKAQ